MPLSPPRLRPALIPGVGLIGALITALVVAAPGTANAVGGLFPSKQAPAELKTRDARVLLVRAEGQTTMHLQLGHTPQSTDFAWLLPLRSLPLDADGQPLPLDRVVRPSSQTVFDRLEQHTAPTFGLRRAYGTWACPDDRAPGGALRPLCEPEFGKVGAACESNIDCDTGLCVTTGAGYVCSLPCDGTCPTGMTCVERCPGSDCGYLCLPDDDFVGASPCPLPELSSSDLIPEVEVVQAAHLGAYEARLLAATDTAQLADWLEDAGFVNPPAAQPLLEDHVARGFVFLLLTLAADDPSGATRPLMLSLGDEPPCLPLGLTALSASPSVALTVWLLGDGRGVSTNAFDLTLDPRALAWPGGSNYPSVLAGALAGLDGPGFITEYSAPASGQIGHFLGLPTEAAVLIAEATDAAGLIAAMVQVGAPLSAELRALARLYLPKPAGLRGFPHGNCWRRADRSETGCEEASADHLTTDEEFYGYLGFWAEQARAGELVLTADLPPLRQRVLDEIIAPLAEVEASLRRATTLTRLSTTLSASQLSRDATFGFNPELPPVERHQLTRAELVTKADAQCQASLEITWPDGSQASRACPAGSCPADFGVAPEPGVAVLKATSILAASGTGQRAQPGDEAALAQEAQWAAAGPCGSEALEASGSAGCAAGDPTSSVPWAVLLLLALWTPPAAAEPASLGFSPTSSETPGGASECRRESAASALADPKLQPKAGESSRLAPP